MRFALLLAMLLPLGTTAQTTDRIAIYGTLGQSPETWHGQADMQAVNFEFAHAISPRTDVAIVLSPTSFDQPRSWFGEQYDDGNERVRAIAASLLMRRTFNRDSSRAQFYGEASTGPMYADRAVPASTSRFNFVSQFGAGV
ncbi:MAG TPA: hypothetical protein VF911_00275, partial [Thermoanaerobaculia bacterium]